MGGIDDPAMEEPDLGAPRGDEPHWFEELRRDLENWRGRPFTREELRGFDLFKVLGTACQLMVTHTSQGEETYANVTAVQPDCLSSDCPSRVASTGRVAQCAGKDSTQARGPMRGTGPTRVPEGSTRARP